VERNAEGKDDAAQPQMADDETLLVDLGPKNRTVTLDDLRRQFVQDFLQALPNSHPLGVSNNGAIAHAAASAFVSCLAAAFSASDSPRRPK
jgi:hypothetical protein